MHTTPRQAATDLVARGLDVANALDSAILAELPADADLLSVHSHRIRLCNHLNNIWHARDLHTQTGDLYDGSGRFWACGSKLCPHCLAKQSKRVRSKLKDAIAEQKLNVGEHWHFLTFTMPMADLSLLDARKALIIAWMLFRKKKWFKDKIIGFFKSEEFTVSRGKVHYHCHVLVRSRFIEYSSMRHFWTESLRSAFPEVGRTFSAATSDGMAIANCRRVGSLSEAVKEVAKYLTKCTSWRKVPTSELLDLADQTLATHDGVWRIAPNS